MLLVNSYCCCKLHSQYPSQNRILLQLLAVTVCLHPYDVPPKPEEKTAEADGGSGEHKSSSESEDR